MKNHLNSLSYEKFCKYYILLSICLYIPFYHISKTLIEASIIILLPLAIKKSETILNKNLFILVAGTLLYSVTFLLAGLIADSITDYDKSLEIVRIIIPLTIIGISITKIKDINTNNLVSALAIGQIITLALIIPKWYQSDFSGRITHGTNLLLIYGASLSATFAVIIFSIKRCSKSAKILAILALTASSISLLASNALGAILALIISIPCVALLYYRNTKILASVAAILITIASAIYIYSPTKNKIYDVIDQVSQSIKNPEIAFNTSQGIRILMWREALSEIKKSPLEIRGSFKLQKIIPEQPGISHFSHVHNDFIQSWFTRGPLGLFSLVLLLLIPYIATKNRETRQAATGLIIVFSVAAMTNVPLLHSYSLRYYLLISIVLITLSNRENKKLIEG